MKGDERIKKDMASAKWLCFAINHSGRKSTQAPVSAGADDLAYALFPLSRNKEGRRTSHGCLLQSETLVREGRTGASVWPEVIFESHSS